MPSIFAALICISQYSIAATRIQFTEPSPDKNKIIRYSFYAPLSGTTIAPEPDNARITIDYYDGYGIIEQSVNFEGASGRQDISRHYETDIYGNMLKEWNPVGVDGNGRFSPTATIKDLSSSFYSDNDAYTDMEYDNTVGMRLYRTHGQGSLWKSGKGVSTEYFRNVDDPSDRLGCVFFTVGANGMLTNNGICREGLYNAVLTEDEDGITSVTFKDYENRTVLQRMTINGGFADTYYVYDTVGNLRYILSPEASKHIGAIETEYDCNDEIIRKYCYVYEYDNRNRCIKKRLPGTEWIFTVYNKYDRVEMTQNGLQREENKWTVYQYDAFGRTVLTNEIAYNHSAETLWSKFSNYASNSVLRSESQNSTMGYTQTAENGTRNNIMTAMFYDNYNFIEYIGDRKKDFEYAEKAGYSKKYVTDKSVSPAQGLQTGGMVRMLHTGKEMFKAIYYDDRGRVIQEIADNHMGGLEKKYYLRNFDGSVARLLHEHTASGNVSTSILYMYTYDHMGRLISTKMSINGGEAIQINGFTYDSVGRISGMSTGSGYSTAYSYNVRNWLTKLTSPLMEQTINYTEHPLRRNPYMNGNINSITTKNNIISPATGKVVGSGKATVIYMYDKLNRLASSTYEPEGRPTNPAAYSTAYNYDLNGNITMLSRQGINERLTEDGEVVYVGYGFTDQIMASYDGNQLLKVKDYMDEVVYGDSFDFRDGADEDVEYEYDANGNMISDLNRGITEIEYDNNNHPYTIRFGNKGKHIYGYDACGRHLSTTYQIYKFSSIPGLEQPFDTIIVADTARLYPGSDHSSKLLPLLQESQNAFGKSDYSDLINPAIFWKTDYCRNYCGEIVYKDGEIERILTDNGYAVPDTIHGGFDFYFYVKDWQGNVIQIMDSGFNRTGINDYYPYGMPKYSDGVQPYKYGTKELDRTNGLDMYDFEARQYDPVLPRFTSIDPLAEKYPSISPYAYCAGNPILFKDPDGMKIVYDPNMTEEQRKQLEFMHDSMMASKTYQTIYNTLEKAEDITVTMRFGETVNDASGNQLPGQFDPETRTITYRDDGNLTGITYSEELVHSYQYYKGILDSPAYNPEYEAKIVVESMIGSLGFPGSFNSLYSKDSTLSNFFSEVYNTGVKITPPFRKQYKNAGRSFVEFYKNHGANAIIQSL